MEGWLAGEWNAWPKWIALAIFLFCFLIRLALNKFLPIHSQIKTKPQKHPQASNVSKLYSLARADASSEQPCQPGVQDGPVLSLKIGWCSDESCSERGSVKAIKKGVQFRIFEKFSEAHLQMLVNELEEKLVLEEQWETVIEKKNDNFSYSAKCCDPKDGSATKYISTTIFENCTTELLRDFYMDDEYRKEWDKTVVEHEQLEINQENGIEIGRIVKKFPFLTPREYVLAWRVWEGKEKSFYCLIKACEHQLAPRQNKYKRVEFYFSGWHIRKVPGRDACEIKVVHQEDAGLKREMAKLFFSKGIWSYVCKMDINLRKYAKRAKSQYIKKPNAVALMQKLPSGIEENPDNDRNPIEASSVESIVTNRKGIQQKRNSFSRSKMKLLAKGLLLLGGTVFLTKGHSSLGAKLAVACLVNKLIKKDGASKDSIQKQLLLRPPIENKHW
ncbi:uncharacterized protein LOC131060449 isoform X2 [Cryptomeria japonica]|uniref:uncharacterized protein LOC131060449 isoform X2 n=1 Tax=Cryptomeria japonica TaxID=3369 RepID=UPI0025AB7BE5|nr:uncharacterized protein LOC131060449 isoform X2 [Cryptomeria japonica]